MGSTKNVPALAELRIGDTILAYQTDRNELVGLAKVSKWKSNGKPQEVYLEPMELIRVKVRPLKAKNLIVKKMAALKAGPIKTLYHISPTEAKALISTAKKYRTRALSS